MKKWLQAALCATALAALAAPATAQPRSKPAKAKVANKRAKHARAGAKSKSNKAPPARVKNYDFLGDELEGDIGRPDGTDLVGRVAAKHANLIRVRTSFLREIGKAAEDM